jgi:hypothetical protein
VSFLVGEQGWQLRESRGRRASARAGAQLTREQGGSGMRAGVDAACKSSFDRVHALLFYRVLSLSFPLLHSPFFLPAPALGHLNRARGDASRHFTAKATPYSMKSGCHQRPTSLLAPTPKRRFGDAPRTP